MATKQAIASLGALIITPHHKPSHHNVYQSTMVLDVTLTTASLKAIPSHTCATLILPRTATMPGWVCDPDGLLSHKQLRQVEALIRTIRLADPPYAQAPCATASPGTGFQLAVALIDQLAPGPAGSTTQKTAHEFAFWLLDAWHVGSDRCDDGALILVGAHDGVVAIVAGRGAQHRLSARAASSIEASLRDPVAAGEYGNAVLQGLAAVGSRLASDPGWHISEGLWDVAIWVLLLGMILMFFHPCRWVFRCCLRMDFVDIVWVLCDGCPAGHMLHLHAPQHAASPHPPTCCLSTPTLLSTQVDVAQKI